MQNWMIYLTFALYLAGMVGVGAYFYTKATKIDDYLLGGRKMGKYVTALSAQASDMSGWLLMGLPGAVYLLGMNQIWIAVGLVVGTYLNWLLVAGRLRVYTGIHESLTLSSFFDSRFKDPTNSLRIISSILTLFFFTVYASSGLVGAGKLFESMFNINYTAAVIIGTCIMIFYTILGGFLAVCWTDVFQATLMVFAIIVLPIIALFYLEPGAFQAAYEAKHSFFSIIPEGELSVVLLAIISTAAWGLGYFGQPHILARFMGIKSVSMLPFSRRLAMIWVVISLIGAVCIGLLAIPHYTSLPTGDQEKVLIFMVRDFVPPYLAGMLLAAILAAIMSTIDSQLLVSSSTLTSDIYKGLFRKNATSKEMMLISRICVVIISLIALSLAFDRNSNIFSLVTFAWGGFGAAFGPVVIMALYSKKTTWYSALAGMIAGASIMLIWYFAGMSKSMYEIVPGFIANFVVMFIINAISPNKNKEIDSEYELMKSNFKQQI